MTVRFPLPIIYTSDIILFLGKEVGEKTVLPVFLQSHKAVIRHGYQALSQDEKDALLRDHLQAKEEEANVPKRASNVALTKAVYSKMEVVTSTVSEHPTFLTHF